jgi:hypothetical protein
MSIAIIFVYILDRLLYNANKIVNLPGVGLDELLNCSKDG